MNTIHISPARYGNEQSVFEIKLDTGSINELKVILAKVSAVLPAVKVEFADSVMGNALLDSIKMGQ